MDLHDIDTSSDALGPGSLVSGRYRLDHVLGRGGMGIVYAATHCSLEQRVAIKLLLPESAADPELVERFAREARATAKLQGDHVAHVLDYGEASFGAPFLVLEYLEGQAVDRLLAKVGRLPVRVAIDYMLQACEGLAEAHAQGIVHRDIKPANLFLAKRPGRTILKVLDFGISKLPTSTQNYALTGDAALMGSPGTMSPEQILGAGAADARSDIWSLGAVLYQMLSGHAPFEGPNAAAQLLSVLHAEPVPLTRVAPGIPVELAILVDRCLRKEPSQRPASVAELASALSPFGSPASAEAAERIARILGGAARSFEPTTTLYPATKVPGEAEAEDAKPDAVTVAMPAIVLEDEPTVVDEAAEERRALTPRSTAPLLAMRPKARAQKRALIAGLVLAVAALSGVLATLLLWPYLYG